ncbi:PREDICTED: protein inturned [Rhagoletis zephyria]|uniref:protein inturned n=1 Tax=Rhagoletis zephyria TaxID=28612 RepID=UPI0008113D97|nr:PREDICTED: protein inturned [Rhagoletis zephyria]
MRKSQPLLLNDQHEAARLGLHSGEGGSESYSSESSFSDSYTDSSDLANWEEHVAEDGTLFYAEYLPQARRPIHEKRIEFARSSSLRMGKKTARRQQQQSQQQQQDQKQKQQGKWNGDGRQPTSAQSPAHEHRFSHISKSHETPNYKQLELVITAADRFRFGRRSTAVESILGFRVLPFPDQPECLMVDSFVHAMPTMLQQQQQQQQQQQPPQSSTESTEIERGDWFKSLDDIEVRASNVDELLLQFVEPTKVCLKFQGVARRDTAGGNGAEQAHANGSTGATSGAGDLQKIENFAMFAQVFEKFQLRALATDGEKSTEVAAAAASSDATADVTLPFALLILPPECYQSDQHKDSLYYYPEDVQANFLYKARGSFLTLNAVLTEELQTKPLISRLQVNSVTYFVCYRSLNGLLVLFAYAAAYNSQSEAGLRADELIGYIRFAFPTLNLQHFTNGNTSTAALRSFLHNFCSIQRVRILRSHRKQPVLFEELLKESRHMPLPKEAQLRIFDALSEMEAMDYRNWNDEPLNTHREFFIHGSVLYYDHYLLASQMPLEVRANVELFLRCRGIFEFISEQNVKELYVWEEVALPQATGRYFLTICSRSHLILAVILKIFDAPDLSPNDIVPPSLFYIEEIQETLDHLIQCGIESLAIFWSISNKRPEVLDKVEQPDEASAEKESRKIENFIKQKFAAAASAATGGTSSSHTSSGQRTLAYDEETHLCSSLGGSSIHSLTPSEDDSSRKRLTAATSAAGNNDDSDSGGSDWDNFGEQNPLHYGCDSVLQSQMTESLWKEINNVVPVKISAGWKNAIFYYVYVDNTNGSVFCPLKANSESFPFLAEMRKACHTIRAVLQNTKHYRRLMAQENTKPAASKGMLAIKEHGVTIQVREVMTDAAAAASAGSTEAEGVVKGRFVVIGRLFNSPLKEVYVCHKPDVPQNMVEMAFRLSFFSVG